MRISDWSSDVCSSDLVADTLERDVTAIMVQTGWQRSLSRGASHQVTNGDAESIGISGGVGGRGSQTAKGKAGQASGNEGGSTASINLQTSDLGVGSTDARSSIDIVNHDVRNAIANAERAASRRSEEHTSELQSLMRISYAVFCLKKKNKKTKSNRSNK